MLDKKFDMVLVGKNYFSLFFSMALLDRNQKVLILDDVDQSIDMDSPFDIMTTLEIEFLNTWLIDSYKRNRCEPLSEIKLEDYLTPQPILYSFNLKQLKIGQRPCLNLLELFRKLPKLLHLANGDPELINFLSNKDGWEEFDLQVISLCQRLGQNAYRYKSIQNFGTDFFVNQSTPFLIKIFELFKQLLHEGGNCEKRENKTLSYLAKGILHKNLSINDIDYETWHLLLHLLGPNYQLNKDQFEKDLLDVFLSRGGKVNKTFIRNWSFHRQKPWAVELGSFEGIIHPTKMSFFGRPPKGSPVILGDTGNFFKVVKIKLFHSDFRLKVQGKNCLVFGNSEKIGSETPFWWSLLKDDHLEVFLLIKDENGSKLSFYQNRVQKILIDDLETLYPKLFANDIGQWEFSLCKDIFIEESFGKKKHTVPLNRKISLYDYSTPEIGEKLKNVYYFGPFKEEPLGPISTLMDLKETHHY